MFRLFIILCVIYLFSGCTTTKPSITEYIITSKVTHVNKNETSTCKDKTIKIAQAFSSASMMSLNMDYVQEPNKVFSYSSSRWQESPNKYVTSKVYELFRDSGYFAFVNVSKSRTKSDLVLEIVIDDFLQYYTNDLNHSYVNIIIGLNIVDKKTSKTIRSKTFYSKVNSKSLDASGGVEALNIALNDILNQNVDWLDGVCK